MPTGKKMGLNSLEYKDNMQPHGRLHSFQGARDDADGIIIRDLTPYPVPGLTSSNVMYMVLQNQEITANDREMLNLLNHPHLVRVIFHVCQDRYRKVAPPTDDVYNSYFHNIYLATASMPENERAAYIDAKATDFIKLCNERYHTTIGTPRPFDQSLLI